jgi:hypothetical protein
MMVLMTIGKLKEWMHFLVIFIFDRYVKLLKQLSPTGVG